MPQPGPGTEPAIQICALNWKLKLQPFCGQTGQGFLSPLSEEAALTFIMEERDNRGKKTAELPVPTKLHETRFLTTPVGNET